ncbi:hypothetical protein RND81_05G105800 [Saponaria officinalis]|uniref:Uncharacterized protein n=1 Tax=Saponaria officinalis TaxID=3572 RepID=A0AAW1KRJ7_SAPOF
MGNLALCMVGGSKPKPKKEKMLLVMKMNDGKLLEFKKSMKVKNLLLNCPNSYVGLFNEATQPLPLEYNLKIGKIYYLFPKLCNIYNNARRIPKPNDGAIRIKVVITRHQLQLLLSNRVQVESIIMDGKQWDNMAQLKKLDCIPE